MLAFPVFYHAQNLKCTDNISGIYTHLFTERKNEQIWDTNTSPRIILKPVVIELINEVANEIAW